MKLALGTVQFGLRYGVANTSGEVSSDEMVSILSMAKTAGMNLLDTASAYGESESRLGEIGVGSWNIVTKLSPLPDDCPNVEKWVSESIATSLRKLRVGKIYGVLLHRSSDLAGPSGQAIHTALRRLQDRGSIEKIGVSIYSPEELEGIVPIHPIQLVQAPFNVVDRRIEASGWLDRLKSKDIEVHARSAFLQGLLLMSDASRPSKFAPWGNIWSLWHGWLRETGQPALAAALGFVQSNAAIDRVIIGVDTSAQLKEILGVARLSSPPPSGLSSQDIRLLNPSHWNTL